MAITKIIAVRDRLDKRINYVVNGKKTSLDASVTYVTNPAKTEQFFFVDAINCDSIQTACQEMEDTKRKWNKQGGVQAYHFIQSFKPGEVTPEQAHAIGMEFSKRLFGERFEVVVGTHLDKAHLHNHIIVNSVSFADGKKYHSNFQSYLRDVRAVSDELCRKYQLSVIEEPKGKGKHYAEWKAEKEEKPTVRSAVREDIDSIIQESYTFQTFLTALQRRGYKVRNNPNRKYISVQPPGVKAWIRLNSLGPQYSEEAIRERLILQRDNGPVQLPGVTVMKVRLRGSIHKAPKKKITGFFALYLRYVYLLRGPKRSRRGRIPVEVRRDVIRLEQYERQFQYLMKAQITTEPQLEERLNIIEAEIQRLRTEREPLYQKRREAGSEQEAEAYGAEIERYTASLRKLYTEQRLCRKIEATIPQVREQVSMVQRKKQQALRKEESRNEHKWRNRRPDGAGGDSDHRECGEVGWTGSEESRGAADSTDER